MMRWGLVPAKIADPDGFKSFSTTNAPAPRAFLKSQYGRDLCNTPAVSFRWMDSTSGYSAQVSRSRLLLSRGNKDCLEISPLR